MEKLIPKKLYKKFNGINAKVTDVKHMLLRCKLFDPSSSWTRYVADYDPETNIAFGFVEGLENEWGDFDITELESYTNRYGLGIERDLYYDPKTYHALYPNANRRLETSTSN